jgi:hypothetical protein
MDETIKSGNGWEYPEAKYKKALLDVDWPEGIKPEEKLFVSFYLSDAQWDVKKAYIMSFLEVDPDKGLANVQSKALKFYNRPIVQEAIDAYVDAVANMNRARARYNIMELYNKRAFYDVTKLLNADGSLKYESLDEVPPEERAAIDGIETRFYGKDADRHATTIKLANRDKSVEMLSKILGMDKKSEDESSDSKNITPIINLSINGSPQITELPDDDEE